MSINRILADLGKAVDSSSTGNFLNKEASGAEFNPVQWSDINSAPTILDSALASAIIDSAYVQARQTGVGSGGIDSATTIALIDSSYVGARASTGGSGFVKYQYTATASQTTFQDSDANGNVLSYDADYILVHYNGVLLPSADYTATDGSSVVLATGADSGSIIGIAKWGAAAGSSSGGGGPAGVWTGDRGVRAGGYNGSTYFNTIDYHSVAISGNATDFGDLTTLAGRNSSTSDGTYGLIQLGLTYNGGLANVNTIEYVTVSTPSNSTDFGDLLTSTNGKCALSNGTYAFFAGNNGNVIEYVAIATPGNTTDFGDMTGTKDEMGGLSDGTYGLICGGSAPQNEIMYFTTATPSNASDFGDLLWNATNYPVTASDTTRGLVGGGADNSTINYITMATPSNASDFGDLYSGTRYAAGGASDLTYATFSGGLVGNGTNVIQQVTIQTTGNATDHGDLTNTIYNCTSFAGSSS